MLNVTQDLSQVIICLLGLLAFTVWVWIRYLNDPIYRRDPFYKKNPKRKKR